MKLWGLLVAHYLLAAYLVLSARWTPLPVVSIIVALPGVLLAVWAWGVMGSQRWAARDQGRASPELITRGPYAIVRHPMYTGLLWVTATLLPVPWAETRLGAWVLLLGVLLAKAKLEERRLRDDLVEDAGSSYVDYQRRVGGFLPRITSKH